LFLSFWLTEEYTFESLSEIWSEVLTSLSESPSLKFDFSDSELLWFYSSKSEFEIIEEFSDSDSDSVESEFDSESDSLSDELDLENELRLCSFN